MKIKNALQVLKDTVEDETMTVSELIAVLDKKEIKNVVLFLKETVEDETMTIGEIMEDLEEYLADKELEE